MKSLICLIFIATAGQASLWQRHVVSEKGESLDTPQPDPLAYFQCAAFPRGGQSEQN